MTRERIGEIERVLGAGLDDSEKSEFNVYEIMAAPGGKPQRIGTLMALAGKGEYWAIEVVIGLGRDNQIRGAYIQRSRERATRALQSPEFLQQFVGKTNDDALEIGRDIKPVTANAEAGSRVVARTVKKMLVFHDVLMKGGSE
jgi:hypothetical protein